MALAPPPHLLGHPGKENIPPFASSTPPPSSTQKSPPRFSPIPLPPCFLRSPLQDITHILSSPSDIFLSDGHISSTHSNRFRLTRGRIYSARRCLASCDTFHSSQQLQCTCVRTLIVASNESKSESEAVRDSDSAEDVSQEECNSKKPSTSNSSVSGINSSTVLGRKRKQSTSAQAVTSSGSTNAKQGSEERQRKRSAVLKFR